MGAKCLVPAKRARLVMLPALLSLAWPAGGALAQTCSLSLLNSVPLTVTRNIVTVPASVGAREKQFQIGTASPDNQMGKDAMIDFGLSATDFVPAHNDGGAGGLSLGMAGGTDIDGTPIGFSSFGAIGGMSGNGIAIYNAKGVMFHSWAQADRFTLGAMQTANLQFVVTDIPEPGSGGILSAGFFQKYDIDLNFRAQRFNMFSSDHCKGQVLYWRAPGVDKLPFRFQNGRITVRVVVDGREMDAVIDTGWPRSEMKFDDVDSFYYLRPNSPGVTREGNGLYGYNFRALSFGSVSIRNPHIVLTHSTAVHGENAGPQTGTLLRKSSRTSDQPELTIGADLLKMLHIYIAFNERMVYVTQASELPEGDANALPVVAVTPRRP
jgi:hypothetical protein